MKDRNLNPHKPARAAMYVYSTRYSQQTGGSMDFWDKLTESEKRLCRELVNEIQHCSDEEKQ